MTTITFPNIELARSYSEGKLNDLRSDLARKISDPRVCVGVCGSYARREASPESDLDFFILYTDANAREAAEAAKKATFEVIRNIDGKDPATGGPFGEIESLSDMLKNIGGSKDSNEKITRRILLLLEGDYLTQKDLFHRARNEIICKYIRDSITDHQLALFLLNDFIRYYRTLCVDFEFKVNEAQKSWGTRNMKLIFSRKLLYFSGILMVAETVQRSPQEKRDILLRYMEMPVIDRVHRICGTHAEPALEIYDRYLNKMASSEFRKICDETKESSKDNDPEFRRLKNESHHFSWRLMSLLRDTFSDGHPIHRVLIL